MEHIVRKQMGAYYTGADITAYIARGTIVTYLLNAACTSHGHLAPGGPGELPDEAPTRGGPGRLPQEPLSLEGEGGPKGRVRVSGELATGPRLCHGDLGRLPSHEVIASINDLLRDDPDRYISPSLKHGAGLALPREIAPGLKHCQKRALWQRPASPDVGLPTETWRETIARRATYEQLRKEISAKGIASPRDLVTLNLDSLLLLTDLIGRCRDPLLLAAIWQATRDLTVLDPTCGRGDFLLAAMDVLTPVYAACLDRIEWFAHAGAAGGDIDVPNDSNATTCQPMAEVDTHGFRRGLACPKESLPGTCDDFPREARAFGERSCREHAIAKAIVLGNLYGVDLMPQAVEACRQRLAERVEQHAGRLPSGSADNAAVLSLESNIQLGNALVGFDWLARFPFLACRGGFDVIVGNPPYVEYSKARGQYQIPPDKYRTLATGNVSACVVEKALGLLAGGEKSSDMCHPQAQRSEAWGCLGAGTPTRTGEGGAGTAPHNPQPATRGRVAGALGMILPLSSFCTQRMAPLVQLVKEHPSGKWISHFSWRPAKLFENVNLPLSILLCLPGEQSLHTTTFNKWYGPYRPHVFETLAYARADGLPSPAHVIPKIGGQIERRILEKMFAQGRTLGDYVLPGGRRRVVSGNSTAACQPTAEAVGTKGVSFLSSPGRGGTSAATVSPLPELGIGGNALSTHGFRRGLPCSIRSSPRTCPCGQEAGEKAVPSPHRLYYRNTGGLYWRIITGFQPAFHQEGRTDASSTECTLVFGDGGTLKAATAVLNSNLWWFFYVVYSSYHHVNPPDLLDFPINLELLTAPRRRQLLALGRSLMAEMAAHSQLRTRRHKGGKTSRIQTFFPSRSKPLVDRIDRILAGHYGLDEQELDFVIHYDGKYRSPVAPG